MGEPSLFWVGGTQPKVILDEVAAFGGGVWVEAPVVVLEPLPVELSPDVTTGVDVVELALVLPVAAAPAAPAPPSAPQPASATAKLPIKNAIAIRSAPIPRSACLIPTPEMHLHPGQARGEVTNRGCTSALLQVQPAKLTRRYDSPRRPRCHRLRAVRPEVLRPRLSTGLPLVQRQASVGCDTSSMSSAARVPALANSLILLKLPAWSQAWWEGKWKGACRVLPTAA